MHKVKIRQSGRALPRDLQIGAEAKLRVISAIFEPALETLHQYVIHSHRKYKQVSRQVMLNEEKLEYLSNFFVFIGFNV